MMTENRDLKYRLIWAARIGEDGISERGFQALVYESAANLLQFGGNSAFFTSFGFAPGETKAHWLISLVGLAADETEATEHGESIRVHLSEISGLDFKLEVEEYGALEAAQATAAALYNGEFDTSLSEGN